MVFTHAWWCFTCYINIIMPTNNKIRTGIWNYQSLIISHGTTILVEEWGIHIAGGMIILLYKYVGIKIVYRYEVISDDNRFIGFLRKIPLRTGYRTRLEPWLTLDYYRALWECSINLKSLLWLLSMDHLDIQHDK